MKLEMYDNSDFDRGAPRWKRGLLVIVRGVFFQNPCPWGSAFRSALLRSFGAKIGKGVGIGMVAHDQASWKRDIHIAGTKKRAPRDANIRFDCVTCARLRIPTSSPIQTREATMFGGRFQAQGCAHPHSHGKLDCNRQPDSPWSNDWRGCGCFRWFGGLKDVPPNCLVRGNPATVV